MAGVTPAEVARAFYEQVLAGEIEAAIARHVADDFVWENPLPEPIPFGGRFEGPAGAAKYLELIFSSVEMQAFAIDELIAADDRVVVLGRETSRVLATGRHYTMDWVHVLRVRGSRILELREYNDTAAMLPAFDAVGA
jgi:ketosteroid isomerase-like protein